VTGSFEEHRAYLHAVAYRMLGSASDADDAVQEAWLRWDRTDNSAIRNPRGWLTTVLAHVCLDMLRVRSARHEDLVGDDMPERADAAIDPAEEAVLADSVGIALLVILQTLSPAERLAFVLHDLFGMPFAEIAPMVGRTPNTAAQLAARARRRVHGRTPRPADDLDRHRRVVEAFLSAALTGDLDQLVTLLDAAVVLRVDATAAGGAPMTVCGAREVSARARMFAANARFAEPVLVDGAAVGLVVAPGGRLTLLLTFDVAGESIAGIDITADAGRLRHAELTLLD
jgi:RNA polymerase sigma-70 factor (ECF subfamily)